MSKQAKWALIGAGVLFLVAIAYFLGQSTQPAQERARPPAEKPEPNPPAEEPAPERERPPVEPTKQDYLNEVSPLIMSAADTMKQVEKVLNDFVNRSLTEEEAANEIRGLKGDLESIRSQIEALTPPQDLQEFENHLVKGLDLYIQGCEKLALGLEQTDPALIEEASSLFEQGTQEIDLANSELEKNTKVLRISPQSLKTVLSNINIKRQFLLILTTFKLSFNR